MNDHQPILLGSWPLLSSLEAYLPTMAVMVPPGWCVFHDGSVLLDVASTAWWKDFCRVFWMRIWRCLFHWVLGSCMLSAFILWYAMAFTMPFHSNMLSLTDTELTFLEATQNKQELLGLLPQWVLWVCRYKIVCWCLHCVCRFVFVFAWFWFGWLVVLVVVCDLLTCTAVIAGLIQSNKVYLRGRCDCCWGFFVVGFAK